MLGLSADAASIVTGNEKIKQNNKRNDKATAKRRLLMTRFVFSPDVFP
jgi:hypothetical protein